MPVEFTKIPRVPISSNVTLVSADQEYSHVLSGDCKFFSLQCRTAFDVRFAFETGKVAGPTAPYSTLKSGGSYNSPEDWGSYSAYSSTIYLASSQAGVVVEVLEWE